MEILNVILHNLIKVEDSTKVELADRKTENAINHSAQHLSKGINEKFNTTGLNMGHFKLAEHDDDPLPHFESLLNKYYIEGQFSDYVAFTAAAARYFQKQLQDAPRAKGGHIWFNHYQHQGNSFLSVVMLREKTAMRIDALELEEFDSVDLDKLHMAARINLTKWIENKDNTGRYISFKIGREAKKVTDYFAKFIGCEEFTESRDDTRILIKAINSYCEQHGFESDKTEKVKAAVYDQITEWKKEGRTSLQLDGLSDVLDAMFLSENSDEQDRNQLLAIAQNEPFNLNNEITPDGRELRKLKRYAGQNKNISISFASELLNKSIFYKDGVLTINEIPQNLKEQLDNKL
ncbi:nucleoid-associated protein [Photobacterium sanguinicancri]|uniref:nucleoid-associated protein n=1 Tax=Photobacterium sanguinicancri TaxID=875932 RepID=UPI0026E17633|nr:nucleoid-associated protein [Photobacterium sanguinicancri]MDO6499596.1 nucleoid-associated protein [Photobacterium sanguinicancri]